MWEIPALAIINELRSRAALKGSAASRSTCSMPAPRRSSGPRWSGCAKLPDLRISDFGTRRRHSFLWQRWCVEALKEGLGRAFIRHEQRAARHGQRPRGDRHQCARAADGAGGAGRRATRRCAHAPYRVLQDWQRYYGGNLLIVLPDTFGTTAFLRDAPDWVADWTGFRPDSAPPIEGGEQIIDWWRAQGPRSARKAAGVLRRARRRHDRTPPIGISTAGCA